MSKELEKMNIISIVQKLKEDDVIILQKYIENLEKENEKLRHYKTLYQSLKKQKDKVIEYINNNTYKCQWGDLEQYNEDININDNLTDTEFIENLLKILEGVNENKNIGDMTESMLKDLIIELQEENSRYERENRKYKETIIKLKNIIKNDDLYEASDFESRKFQKDLLNIFRRGGINEKIL